MGWHMPASVSSLRIKFSNDVYTRRNFSLQNLRFQERKFRERWSHEPLIMVLVDHPETEEYQYYSHYFFEN